MHRYTAAIEIDTAKLGPSVAHVFDTINQTMSEFGFTEKLVGRTRLGTITIDSPVELTPDQLQRMHEFSEANVKAQFARFEPTLLPFEKVAA